MASSNLGVGRSNPSGRAMISSSQLDICNILKHFEIPKTHSISFELAEGVNSHPSFLNQLTASKIR